MQLREGPSREQTDPRPTQPWGLALGLTAAGGTQSSHEERGSRMGRHLAADIQ